MILPPGPFGCILADPPWRFRTFNGKSAVPTTAPDPYRTMPLDEIKALDVAGVAARDCALIMWATAPLMPQAFDVMAAWGFTFKTMGCWAKQSSTGRKWAFGTGYVLRGASEFYLIGARGAPPVRSRSVRNLIVAPVREHSRKPDQIYRDCEALYAGPYLEMFARQTAPGWSVCGDQTDKFGRVAE
jgi:N6-adenosine-specific RNA methylase IME4